MEAIELHRGPDGVWSWQKSDSDQLGQPTELTSVKVVDPREVNELQSKILGRGFKWICR